jgi:putative membrane protein
MHMFLAGCLLSWAVIGIDPIRRRPGTCVKLTALVIAAAGHDTLARLIYAWNLPAGGGPTASRHTGAELMYYGGTVIEVALAAVVMAQWYLASGRALARTRRRSDSVGATADNRTAQPAPWLSSTDSSIRASRGLHPWPGTWWR